MLLRSHFFHDLCMLVSSQRLDVGVSLLRRQRDNARCLANDLAAPSPISSNAANIAER